MTRPAALLLLLGLAMSPLVLSCGKSESKPTAKRMPRPSPGQKPQPVDRALVARALRALESKLPESATFLEIRVLPSQVELQLIADQSVTSLRYREQALPGAPQLAEPLGRVDPPVQVPVYGEGDLKENGFSASEVDLPAITNAFGTAIKAVDPTDGWVKEVVIRRYLPFGTAVRARIYVASPRMSGSIDTNGNGIPLRRY